ncbi:MAG: RdgB/HAM1 family non-canonical purine NTP pyrophosphatase [Rhodospirillales bacterium]|nr:RdgB/HAM1 family non-canonical purine NTP pyrophosphatase [Rhodospirillales bacterium]
MIHLARGSRLVIATHNPGKLAEMSALLAPYGIDTVAAGALGLAEPDETAADFEGNARLKALAAARDSGLPALADDSGFCVAALDGAPGVVSARWAGPGRDFRVAMARVERDMGAAADRRAWFVSVLCLALADGEAACFAGRVDGAVSFPPRGGHGFGYDPIFVPDGDTRTFGEMPPGEKEAISHRTRAFRAFAAACLSPP